MPLMIERIFVHHLMISIDGKCESLAIVSGLGHETILYAACFMASHFTGSKGDSSPRLPVFVFVVVVILFLLLFCGGYF